MNSGTYLCRRRRLSAFHKLNLVVISVINHGRKHRNMHVRCDAAMPQCRNAWERYALSSDFNQHRQFNKHMFHSEKSIFHETTHKKSMH